MGVDVPVGISFRVKNHCLVPHPQALEKISECDGPFVLKMTDFITREAVIKLDI